MMYEWATFEGDLPNVTIWLRQRGAEGYALVSHTTVVRRAWRVANGPTENGEMSTHAIIMRRPVQAQ